MCLESYRDVVVQRKQVVEKDDVVFAAGDEKSAVFRKLDPTDVGTMPCFVLLQQYQRLEASVYTTTFVYCKALLLTDTKQPSILTEGRSSYGAFEVELSNYKIALQIEDSCMSSVIDRDHCYSIRRDEDDCVSMGILKGKEICFVVLKVDFFDGVADGSVDEIIGEDAVAVGVGAFEKFRDCGVTVENHKNYNSLIYQTI